MNAHDFTTTRSPMYAGIKIIESELATAEPNAQPATDDMRDMVDHLRSLGQIARKPCAFEMGGTLVIHPVLHAELKRHLRKASDDIRNKMERAAMWGLAI